ncbi:HAMP domain-containing sensor histidine kinase [Actinoallomurus vinaceus]|uniref:histidine kinase n=1 Tax=Actinoallomurus vinaceus TaxID=1080074 RepID=A0ABP8UD89_9ACTN
MRVPSPRRLSLRSRVALLAAGAVILAIVIVAFAADTLLQNELRGQIDQTLISQAKSFAHSPDDRPGDRHDGRLLASMGISVAIVHPDGSVMTPPGTTLRVPVDSADVRAVSAGPGPPDRLRSAYSGDVHVRVVTTRAPDGTVIVLARSLADVDRTVLQLQLGTVIFGLGAVTLAATAGFAVAGAGLRPVRNLTRAAARIARTQDLDPTPIEVTGGGEIAELAHSFNAMLAALNRSRERQRQLVSDAGHELRTPLTSLRTNIDLLIQIQRHPERTLPQGTHDRLLADVKAQLMELTTLVGDLVELAREDETPRLRVPVRFDEIVQHAVERVRLRAPATVFSVNVEPWVVEGAEPELARAVTNLLDNAVKFGPPDGTVWVVLRDGELVVADEGPGIEPGDLPYVFERFYRSAAARAASGSGLGLAIVRNAAEHHAGQVLAENRPGGGALIRLRLPGVPGPGGAPPPEAGSTVPTGPRPRSRGRRPADADQPAQR